MEKQFRLPGISCEYCNAGLYLIMKTNWLKVDSLILFCRECYSKQDLLEEVGDTLDDTKQKAKQLVEKLSKTLLELKDTLPKDKEQFKDVVKNPKHPFTVTLLTGLFYFLRVQGTLDREKHVAPVLWKQ